jgi:LCP family protein required for cell wall assembly
MKQQKNQGRKTTSKDQEMRRRRLLEESQKRMVSDNPAKAVAGKKQKGKTSSTSKKGNKGKGTSTEQEFSVSRTLGMGMAVLQGLFSLVFLCALMILNLLPMKFVGAIALVLLICFAFAFLHHKYSQKKLVGTKVFSFVMLVFLLLASYYCLQTSGVLRSISGGDTKLDRIVVAVLATDSAQTIQDAKDYNFGVQYSIKGDDIRQTESAIEEEVGQEITTTTYSSLYDQAMGLHNGEVQAIIYNDAYTSILEETIEGFDEGIRIIYEYEIVSQLLNVAADVKVEDETFCVYISGIDVYGAIETNSRSDVNILAVVNPNTHQILLVTTPRDFYVEIPGVSGGQKDKLTHAGIYGVDASMATLSQIYNVEIPFYARVNFTSLVEMVDALGGVEVVSEQAFTTSADTGLVMNVQAGTNYFNGQQALAFSRERYNVVGGDFQRGKNQQAVITAMIKKAISPAILTGANAILNSVSGNVDTNMSQEQIQELIKSQLADGEGWNIKSMAAEGTGDSAVCYSSPGSYLYVTIPDTASIVTIQEAIQAVYNGELLEDSEMAGE